MDRLDLFGAFFTESSKYYKQELVNFENGKRFSFNFWAGFFGTMWFIYRRMYRQALVVFLARFAFTIFLTLLLTRINPFDPYNQLYLQLFSWSLFFVILGLIGNRIYLLKSIKIVNDCKDKYNNESTDNLLIQELRKKGGTSMENALIFLGVIIFIQILTKFLLTH